MTTSGLTDKQIRARKLNARPASEKVGGGGALRRVHQIHQRSNRPVEGLRGCEHTNLQDIWSGGARIGWASGNLISIGPRLSANRA
jgi:hypothetical protein